MSEKVHAVDHVSGPGSACPEKAAIARFPDEPAEPRAITRPHRMGLMRSLPFEARFPEMRGATPPDAPDHSTRLQSFLEAVNRLEKETG